MSTQDLIALDSLDAYELIPGHADPRSSVVLGTDDFVLGRVRRLIVSVEREEVVYLVVSTAMSNFTGAKGEERLVPLEWAELIPHRRQVKLPHLSSFGFRRLPVYLPGAALPSRVAFAASSDR